MTPEAQALVELAARCEAATGADRELDRAIELAVLPDRIDPCPTVELLAYTASLDAAMSLVPKGWFTRLALEDRHSHSWRWELRGGYGWNVGARAPTASLALCAASLHARAALLEKLERVDGVGEGARG